MARRRPWSRPRPLPRDAYVHDDPFLPVEEGVFVDDVDTDEVSAGGAPRFPLVQQAPRRTPATSLTWQQQLASLRSAMAQPWRPTRGWPERRELVHVFAEKILELQATRRDLADSIVSADNGLIRGITREDLELLLS